MMLFSVPFHVYRVQISGAILNRTYGAQKKSIWYILRYFLQQASIWSYLLWSPAVVVAPQCWSDMIVPMPPDMGESALRTDGVTVTAAACGVMPAPAAIKIVIRGTIVNRTK